jgi:uncharacterized protein YaiI (UPF0178 family)
MSPHADPDICVTQILVDADSCPREARKMVLRFAGRLGIKTVFAANRLIPALPKTARMELCPQGEGEADKRILALARPGDLVLTRDLPLAEKLVDGGIAVLDDRGRVFTKENIRELRSVRDFVVGLADNGLDIERIPSYGKEELNALANSLDRELSKGIREQGSKGTRAEDTE